MKTVSVINYKGGVGGDAPEYGVPVVLKRVYGQTYEAVQKELEQLTTEFVERTGR